VFLGVTAYLLHVLSIPHFLSLYIRIGAECIGSSEEERWQ